MVLAEAALLELQRSDFELALDLFQRAGYTSEADYVGEAVLTTEELKAYVDRRWPPARNKKPRFQMTPAEERETRVREQARELLGRRLVREGRRREAKVYFSRSEQRDRLDEYDRLLSHGRNAQVGKSERARALWDAALLARSDPECPIMGNWSQVHAASDYPRNREPGAEVDERPALVASEEERARVHEHTGGIPRFSYKYVAADHAWEAAALLPDNDPRTVAILYIAGDWLKHKDPMAADRFYKALATRCVETELGAEAARLHWFPKDRTSPDGVPW
jgi:hypothetical protein